MLMLQVRSMLELELDWLQLEPSHTSQVGHDGMAMLTDSDIFEQEQHVGDTDHVVTNEQPVTTWNHLCGNWT